MALPLLGTLGSIFGFAQNGVSLGAVQAAGQAQLGQAASALIGNLKQNGDVGQSMTDTSNTLLIQNALIGKYLMRQNSAALTYQTQLQVANKWMSVLSGSQQY